jgi:hypothetical protein
MNNPNNAQISEYEGNPMGYAGDPDADLAADMNGETEFTDSGLGELHLGDDDGEDNLADIEEELAAEEIGEGGE